MEFLVCRVAADRLESLDPRDPDVLARFMHLACAESMLFQGDFRDSGGVVENHVTSVALDGHTARFQFIELVFCALAARFQQFFLIDFV
ncbi:MAG: hypothetical protein HQM03_09720 [Magnetococcales bacterium]|nr:hypothetical protein [Magnetococcales bacterium]